LSYHPDKLLKCYKQVFKPGKAGGHDRITSKEALLIGEEILTRLARLASSKHHRRLAQSIEKGKVVGVILID